ncbi:PLP-dependent transferase [Polaribacter ponticola]|uniref:PLP-dependent transferase n=1 Tax=Polaribacter ponticola TaxID=2978475 RepID=A0ABT5SD63_9FLAO|nr:PLP-dependent transferase [Polaribacter sp. MSW5]MDD7915376.1 PLP-dependent transferase [Polaribacter sp. MSW5]
MENNTAQNYVKNVITNMPNSWLKLTTHRLDIYNEQQAKTEFIDQFETLFSENNFDKSVLNNLPTAYDYIRLGHPLSCILEWTIAKLQNVNSENVISFTSQTIPVLSILRKNLLENKKTQILYIDKLPSFFNVDIIKNIYGYNFELKQIKNISEINNFNGSTIFISKEDKIENIKLTKSIDFLINLQENLGSFLIVNGIQNENYISDIQHVRRRETIAMTPSNSLIALQSIITSNKNDASNIDSSSKIKVSNSINAITNTTTKSLVASSGLSIQYAILMGLIHDAKENHKGKAIKIVVPPNCYGGTNDQARRVAACLDNVAVVDLPVDGENDMVKSIDSVLNKIAFDDAIPYIIAEIPTNPRVEVPNLIDLKDTLSKQRKTSNGELAIDPVFVLDQTFCPNVHFLGNEDILSSVRTISFASGSKFPSGGLCTAGYCVGNLKTNSLIEKIELHLQICDNEATSYQYNILAKQMPSMNQRIVDAYKNTREFVNYIKETLPTAKINFVSEQLAEQGFTPSVFSLDLPTKGNTNEEKETYKRALNHKLINLMITEIPDESKYCVSYGQLKGCYWTIPATSTQGTTKEGDKDYIARVALSANMDLDLHKKVFLKFVKSI